MRTIVVVQCFPAFSRWRTVECVNWCAGACTLKLVGFRWRSIVIAAISYFNWAKCLNCTLYCGTIKGVTRAARGAPNHSGGAEWLRGAPKSPNDVTSAFYNTVHLLLKTSVSNMVAPNLLLAPGAIQPCYAAGHNTFTFPRSAYRCRNTGEYSGVVV